jgi:uncharacterized membrane protein YfcA
VWAHHERAVTLLLAIAAALLIGVTLGLLGGGGTILTVPLLVYALGLSPKNAIATSLVVVAATAAASLFVHARAGHVQWRTGLIFGGVGMLGAYAGGLLGARVPGQVLLVAFASMMVVTAIAMLRRGPAVVPAREHALPKILLEGFVVGAVTGFVGAGGGFLVVPALALLGGLSMRDAVGTSVLVIALKSSAGFVGYAGHVEVDWPLAAVMSAAAIVGSLLGARVAHRVPQAKLRRGFAIFVLASGVAMVVAELCARSQLCTPTG